MQVFESIDAAHLKGPTHLTIGSFDGMHRGHQALTMDMQQAAHEQGAACGLLSFHPHPRAVLHPEQPPTSISSLSQRLKLYAAAGLDFSIIHPFTRRTAQTPPDIFMDALKAHLALSDLWVGPDFALGKDRQGDVAFLRSYGQKIGVQVHVASEFRWENVVIRSSHIRRVIAMGNVAWANVWLGRLFTLPGVIVHGEQRGRLLGFPTANLSLAQNRVRPADGVYAAWAEVEGERFPAVVNIGMRPTVGGRARTIEAHLIDFDDDIYGRCLQLSFVARLRDEMKFSGLDALKAQIARDKAQADWLLAATPPLPPYQRYLLRDDAGAQSVEVQGDTPEALYAHAAIAFAGQQQAYDVHGPTVQQYIEVEGADQEELLAKWLHELRWQQSAQGLMPQNVMVQELTPTHLRALVFGRIGPQTTPNAPPHFHEVSIHAPRRPGELWRARLATRN